MILYINKNCSGYHWHECSLPDIEEFDGENTIITIARCSSQNVRRSNLVSKLMVNSDYEYCLAKDDGIYLLALNDIPENERVDDFNRPIQVTLIFVAEKQDEHAILLKILLDRIKSFKRFSEQLNECFVSNIDEGCVLCRWHILAPYLKNIKARSLTRDATSRLLTDNTRLLAAKGDTRALKEFGFSDSEIKIAKKNRLLNLIEEIDKDEELTTDPDSHATKTTDPELGKTDDDLTPDELRAKLSKLKADKQALDTNVETLSSTVRGLKEKLSKSDLTIKDLAKKIRLRNGIIASLVAIIIILIIITLF